MVESDGKKVQVSDQRGETLPVSLDGVAAELMNLYEGHEAADTRIRGTKAVLEHLDHWEITRAANRNSTSK